MHILKIELELEVEDSMMPTCEESREFFRELIETPERDHLRLHSNDIGDTLGVVRRSKILSSL